MAQREPVSHSTPIELVEQVYARLPGRADAARERFGRPITLAEKVLANHLRDPELSTQSFDRARSYADFDPDRVALQDALVRRSGRAPGRMRRRAADDPRRA